MIYLKIKKQQNNFKKIMFYIITEFMPKIYNN